MRSCILCARIPVNDDLSSRSEKRPSFKSLFGLGTITRSRLIQNEQFISDKNIGIISTDKIEHTFRISDENMLPLIENILVNN